MTVAGIEGIHRRRHSEKRSRIGAGSVAPDLVGRQFVADHPDRLWGADISQLRTREGFRYLAVVLDACTRRVVGWAMADHLRRELVLDALGMAPVRQQPARAGGRRAAPAAASRSGPRRQTRTPRLIGQDRDLADSRGPVGDRDGQIDHHPARVVSRSGSLDPGQHMGQLAGQRGPVRNISQQPGSDV